MSLSAEQLKFAAHIRDPDRCPPPEGVEPRRMRVYRELFFNNLVELLGGGFPVVRRILGTERWRALVRDFYAGHKAHTPYFLKLPGEFVEWLAARASRSGAEPPFLQELAHYEWIELALAVDEAEAPVGAPAPEVDLADVPLAVSPLAWPLAYRWPVHRIGPGHEPAEPPATPTFLLVYRDAEDEVRFLETGSDVARLLDALESTPGLTPRRALSLHDASPAEDRLAEIRRVVADLIARGALVVRDAAVGHGA